MAELCLGLYSSNSGREKFVTNLDSIPIFARHTVREVLRFSAREMLSRIKPESVIDLVIHPTKSLQVYVVGITTLLESVLIFSTKSKPHDDLLMVAKHILAHGLDDSIQKNFDDADKIKRISNDIEMTKKTMIDNVDKLLDNGEKMEDLVEKTAKLAKVSKGFRDRTDELNDKCCILI